MVAFWETGDREFFQSGKLVFFTEDFVLISSTADCALLPHFLDSFFIAPWTVGHREISAGDKDSSEAYAIKVEGICSRSAINMGPAHFI